jgi:hypothetical protein
MNVVQERVREGAEAVDRDGGSACGAGLLVGAAHNAGWLLGHFVEQAICIQV